eukprot:2595581-Pleurochrysis_carterae.AAC.1
MPTRKERAGPRVIARSLAQAVQLKASGFALPNAPANHRGASDAGEARDAAHNSPQHEARTSARTEALAQLDVAFVTAVRCLDSRTVIRAVAKGALRPHLLLMLRTAPDASNRAPVLRTVCTNRSNTRPAVLLTQSFRLLQLALRHRS